MKPIFRKRFVEELESFSEEIQNRFRKQLGFLLHNIRHPSLRAKKYGGVDNIWQARTDKNVRFYFKIENDAITLLSIIKHPE